MHAQHEPASHIHDWPDRGGCPGAVAHARDAIQHHGRYVVVADIRDCYPSFNPDYLYQIDLLPPEPSRAALDSRELRYSLRGDVPYGYDRTEQTRPRGLLQGGAASSSILAYALNDLPEHLPNDVVPICQSDNFIIVCRSRVECEAAAEALSRYLRGNPAGAFSPRMEMVWVRDPLDGSDPAAIHWPSRFDQFGYSFAMSAQGECEVGLSFPNLMKVMNDVHEYLDRLEPQQAPIDDFLSELRMRVAGFPALSDAPVDYIAQALEPDFVQKLIAVSRFKELKAQKVDHDEDASVLGETE